MTGLLESQYAEPSSTGVAHDNIDELLAENRRQSQEEQYDLHGTIGPTPFMDTEEGQDLLLSLVTGSPGSAIGRISKSAITGGQVTNKVLRKLLKQKGKPTKGMDLSPGSMHGKLNQIKSDNKINSSRIAMGKALDKFGIKHEPSFLDPVTKMLREGKMNRNWDHSQEQIAKYLKKK